LTGCAAGAKLRLLVTLAPGTRLGPYQILEPLGAGGMGEVYRARDTRLHRDVALKVLSERLAGRPDALERFEREARTVGSLSHPNILALYDFGSHDNTVYAVTELLEGESLDRRIGRGGMHWRQAVEVAAAIADGLSSAHSKGVVHRDLKPANVFITLDGVVKILDFGLATAAVSAEDDQTAGPTALTLTKPGTILGTVGYMSPEQVRGEPVDHRTDLFALGCIVAEMLTGKRAFAGNTPNETLAAILRDEPEGLDDPAGQLAPNAAAVVRRCLEKDRDRRFQSARDLAFALRALLSGSQPSVVPDPRPKVSYRRWLVVGLAIVAVLAVLAAGGPPILDAIQTRLTPSKPVRSIAVLPLVNRSGDAAQDYFVDGITDQLIAGLARIDGLRVTSRTSAMTYKAAPKPVREMAQKLGVDMVLEGSVARNASRVILTTNLVDASTEKVLWSNTYDRDVRDLLQVQGEIADQIVRNVSIELSPEDRAQLQGAQMDPAAFDAYVRGRYYWNKRGPDDLARAVDEFRRAIDVDPTYAAAYAGLADAYAQIGYQASARPLDVYPKAKAAAIQAVRLAPNLAEPHASLGFVHMYFDLDFAASEREFQQAIALNDNAVTAHHGYSVLLAALLRPDEARREIDRARVLDPLSPLVATDAGFETYYDRRYDEAHKVLNEAISLNPEEWLAHFWLARTLQAEKRYDEAIAEYRQPSGSFGNTQSISGVGHLYGVTGRRDEAQKLLAQMDELSTKRYVSPYVWTLIYLGLGDRENTLTWLQRTYDERVNGLVWLLKDPRWDPMRGDPGFEAIVTRVGFPADSRARAPRPLAKPL
jgi:serine/threonine-protein kinase